MILRVPNHTNQLILAQNQAQIAVFRVALSLTETKKVIAPYKINKPTPTRFID